MRALGLDFHVRRLFFRCLCCWGVSLYYGRPSASPLASIFCLCEVRKAREQPAAPEPGSNSRSRPVVPDALFAHAAPSTRPVNAARDAVDAIDTQNTSYSAASASATASSFK